MGGGEWLCEVPTYSDVAIQRTAIFVTLSQAKDQVARHQRSSLLRTVYYDLILRFAQDESGNNGAAGAILNGACIRK